MKLINNNKIKNKKDKLSNDNKKNKEIKENKESNELFLKNVIQQISEIAKVESVDGIDQSRIPALKIKTIELLSEYATEKAKDPLFWKYYIYESDDFSAYLNTSFRNGDKAVIVFHQYVGPSNLHSYFENAKEMLKAINHLFGRKLEKEEEVSRQR